MHNAATLMKGEPRATARGSTPTTPRPPASVDGDSRAHRVAATARSRPRRALTDEVGPGTIAVPHGWGHRGGGWRRANAAGGANVNELMSSDPEDLERLAGMSLLNGVAVRIEAAAHVGPPRSERVTA